MATALYPLLWCVSSLVLACLFLQSAYRDFPRTTPWSCSCGLSARIWINACAAIYNAAAGIAEGFVNYGDVDDTPFLLMEFLVLILRVANLAISIIMLHLYMHICGCWTNSRRFARGKWCSTVSLSLFTLVWWLLDRGLTWYKDAWPSYSQSSYSWIMPWSMPSYYIVATVVEVACCCILFYLQRFFQNQSSAVDGLGDSQDGERLEGLDSSLWSDLSVPSVEHSALSASPVLDYEICRVLRWNCFVAGATLAMSIIQLPSIKAFLVQRNGYGGVMLFLYCARYGIFYRLARPAGTSSAPSLRQDIDDALHFAGHISDSRWQNYPFQRGAGMVICNWNYHENTGLPLLQEDHDLDRRFWNVFGLLGFPSSLFSNLTGNAIRDRFRKLVTQAGDDDVDGIALGYLGHGGQDCIVGVDGDRVAIQELIDIIWNEARLSNRPKPKILFFDCCRGLAEEFSRRSRVSLTNRLPPRMGSLRTRPSVHADFLLCHATTEGFVAHNHNGRALFSHTLVETIEAMFAPDSPSGEVATDIHGLLTMVNGNVSGSRIGHGLLYKQCPQVITTLTRNFVVRSQLRSQDASARRRAFSAPLCPSPTIAVPESRVVRAGSV